ncbi:MAG: alpha/beta hydrolase [Lachnospiraceae bacterium]|nr:alpha/beta hydrolase [Lachnospiraceae bacterium]
MSLVFDSTTYEIKTLVHEGVTVTYRAFTHIPYVEKPVLPDWQCLSIYVPEAYYKDEASINGYNLATAPIFFPNAVGGYKPGKECEPEIWTDDNTGATHANSLFHALAHGYVVVSAGLRGRGMKDENDKFIGCAPAVICDLKAVIRYLRFNKGRVPGNVERIISNGTSAGGAISSLLGSTGNHPDYEPYLKAMGAANATDNIFAASCYCPITNLDHADMAYEWEFGRCGTKTPERETISKELQAMFPTYVNGLKLKDELGNALTLNANGTGAFADYVKEQVIMTCEKELTKGTDLSSYDWIVVKDGKVVDIDLTKYIFYRTRMKEAPAFDNIAMGTPENELFGNENTFYRHFTKFACEHSEVNGELAEEMQIKMMNPMNYIDDASATKAQYFRIRHGAIDRDTSLAIPVILATKLKNQGIDADFALPWGVPHAGDYDLDELFEWVDKVCAEP